jgi:hypothetical protein
MELRTGLLIAVAAVIVLSIVAFTVCIAGLIIHTFFGPCKVMVALREFVPMPVRVTLKCSVCSADGTGSCDCGAPYMRAGERAARAVAANPEKSDRSIAAEIGVSDKTVAAARKASSASSEVQFRVPGWKVT